MAITANESITDHFTLRECRCPCCQRIRIGDILFRHMEKLETARQRLGFAIVINSGYRCLEHNKAIGGSKGSWHMDFATDARPGWSGGVDDDEFIRRLGAMHGMALELIFGGIEKHSTFIHLDTRPILWRSVK